MLGESEPCGLVIQMASLPRQSDVRPGGVTCVSREEVGRDTPGCYRPVAGQGPCPAIQIRVWICSLFIV